MGKANLNCQVSSGAPRANREIFKHIPEAGNDITAFESLMYQYWSPDMLKAERARMRSTWFDYRHIHPVLRSFVFVREYDLAHQRAFKRFYGVAKEPFEDRPRNAGTSLYRRTGHTIKVTISRMHLIDELGCPYDSFFNAAFDYCMQEKGFLDWKSNHEFLEGVKLPPLTLLADAATLISSQKAFEQKNSYKMKLPEHSHYQAKNWCGSDTQKDFALWLIQTAQARGGDRDMVLARLAYQAGLLRENEVARHLGLNVVKAMRSMKSKIITH